MTPPGAADTNRRWPRSKIFSAWASIVVAAVLIGAAAGQLFHLGPVVAEMFWLAGLVSGIAPAQEEAIRRLRDYPTRSTALALVAVINVSNLHRLPDSGRQETVEEKEERLAVRARDLKLAERATETLCLLSGRSFGTDFRKEARGHSWRGLDEERWPEVLGQINLWAARAFGNARGADS